MTAYSFKQRFVGPILAGTKDQTIRATGKRRHAQPGREVQLYYGMRTKHCRLIARAPCLIVDPVRLRFARVGERCTATELFEVAGGLINLKAMERLAVSDGFESVDDMAAFWFAEHADKHASAIDFEGVLIRWRPVTGEA